MSSGPPDGLQQDLLDDFYAECDELISTLRRSITAAESGARNATADRAVLEELFRAMHSLKGICAIAGVRPAEQLAHAVEDLLRALTRQQLALSPEILDLLLEATERLHKIVDAHRRDRKLPGVGDLLPRLSARLPSAGSPAAQPAPASAETAAASAPVDPVAAARARGREIWRGTFLPSPALDQRGIKVNTIRERLAQAGEILGAVPAVRPGGGLSFEFTVALPAAPANLAEWAADGLAFEPVPAAAPAAEPAGELLSLTPSHIVRVDLGRLDDLMRITGEIIIHRSRLEDRLGHRQAANEDLKAIDLALARSLRELRAAVSRVRLVPVAEIFSRMPYVLRDLARESGKKAAMTLEGQQTEIDKYLVERLKEPLLHLVRNAFAHAIEPPEERMRAGKPAEAAIRLSAARVGDAVEIRVADDGRGIDAAQVAARAAALGLPRPAQMDAAGMLNVLCQPGFSTREEADRASGRGVGMAVVLNTVRELGGTLRLETAPGRGTEFILRLPLTLAIADVLVVKVAEQTCALPQSHVEEIIQAPAAASRAIQQAEVIPYRGGLLPLYRLRTLFRREALPGDELVVVVVSSERGSTGLVVDRAVSRREVVVRAFSDPLVRVPGISGATELGDGRPILILDPGAITAGVVRPAIDLASPVAEAMREPGA